MRFHVLESDNLAAAQQRAKTMDDPRAQYFYDPGRRAGKAIANISGGRRKDRLGY